MIYHVFANRSNIGDWLSAKGIQKLLEPHAVTECLCDEPFVDETIETLSRATADDFIVIGGGGLFMDYFVPFWEAFQHTVWRVPFCIWGAGFCDLKSEFTLPPMPLMREIIKQSKLCIVRDELSRFYLSDCGLPPSVPCPSVNAIDYAQTRGSGILHVDNFSTVGETQYREMDEAAKTFAAKKGIKFRHTNNRIPGDSTRKLDETLLLYADSEFIFSSALHGCVIGVAMGKKVLTVSGDRKIEGFMEAVGLRDWVLETGQLERIPQRLEELHSQEVPTKFLEDIKDKNRKIGLQVKQIIDLTSN